MSVFWEKQNWCKIETEVIATGEVSSLIKSNKLLVLTSVVEGNSANYSVT